MTVCLKEKTNLRSKTYNVFKN